MENEPVAAPQTGTEENPITNPTPAAEPAAPVANIPAEQIEAFNKFVAGQGGFDNAFANWKKMVSDPQQKAEATQAPVAPVQPEQPVQPAQPAQPVQPVVPDGYITAQEYMTREYFRSLSGEEKYSTIADEIRDGSVLKEMKEFGISATKDGMFNDAQIRKFLDLKAKTVPAQAPVAPITTTPTVDWVNVGEEITNMDAAREVLRQNMTSGKNGSEHPMTQKAKEYIKNFYSSKK